MTDFLVTFLAALLREQGVPNPVQVAEKAAATLRKAHIIDEDGLKRAAIRADPCADYKLLARHHHCSIALVYKAWKEK